MDHVYHTSHIRALIPDGQGSLQGCPVTGDEGPLELNTDNARHTWEHLQLIVQNTAENLQIF